MKTILFPHNTKTYFRIATFIVALLATTVLPVFSDLPPAFAGTDSYPTSIGGCRAVSGSPSGYFTCDLKDSTQDIYWDPWGEYNRECTSYVAWMLSSVNGFTMPFHDDAANWGSDATSRGYTVDMNPQPGSIFWSTSIDHVGWVESVSGGQVTYEDYNYDLAGHWGERTVATTSASGYIHFKDVSGGTTYPDGTYLHATDSGGIYVVAGGAPMYVSSWANVGGSHPYTDTTQSVINSMPTYPRNGTYIHAYTAGGVYDVAGGAAMHVTSWSNVGGSHPYTDVDAWVITNQLRQYPFDGTYLHAYTTGGIYVIAGGSAMYVSSWTNVGGTHPTTDVDSWVIANQLLQYPLNGTYLHAYTTGGIYVVAGGAPMYVSSWTYVGGTHPDTDVDTWVLSNQLRAHPSDATYVQPYGNAAIYEAAGGAALSVSTWSDVGGPYPVTVIPSDSLPQFLSYPQDGTYVKGYQSGEEFEAMSSAVTRITTTPLPPATNVDDWAIVNQLGGVE